MLARKYANKQWLSYRQKRCAREQRHSSATDRVTPSSRAANKPPPVSSCALLPRWCEVL